MAGETLRDRDRIRLNKVADARKELGAIGASSLSVIETMMLRVLGILLDVVEDLVREKAGLKENG